MPFYTYILFSEKTGKHYIGQTNNLADRLHRHNSNQSIATRNKSPWVVIYQQEFQTREEAVQLERKLKRFKNKQYLLDWINLQSR